MGKVDLRGLCCVDTCTTTSGGLLVGGPLPRHQCRGLVHLAGHLRRFPAEPGELVLRSPAGLPLDSDRFGHQWRGACRSAGVPGLGYHALRHTFASTLLSRVSVKAVADWLGHASPTIALATYAHLMPADEEVARAVLDAALAPGDCAPDVHHPEAAEA